MQLFQRIFPNHEGQPEHGLYLDPSLLAAIAEVAQQEQKSIEQYIEELLQNDLEGHITKQAAEAIWHELTPREKEAAGFTCLGYTNKQIAETMVISINTVKTHIKSIRKKFNITSKEELRTLLADWDFAHWVESQDLLLTDNPAHTDTDSSLD